ncbi:MAG: TlpA family protein disulfide reductase [Bacteroidales bacterium]|nr:TlpA family protein disulfide reductase [Bacteroidales bacterium]
MKSKQLTLTILLISLLSCQNPKKIVINGEIIGNVPEKIEYTVPIHGICNWAFKDFVQPDSLGKFKIEIETEKEAFIKLMTNSAQGTLIIEPGKTYSVNFDFNNKEKIFSVTGRNYLFQETYNKLPSPIHIQVGAKEFLYDTIADNIKATIDKRRTNEIAVFEKFLSDKKISKNVFEMIKTDRNTYYDAILSTIAWIKDLMVIEGREKVFPEDFRNLWIETFDQSLITNPEVAKSPWFNFYAESYLYFRDYMNNDFTKEKLDALNESGQIKIYRVNKAKEYLPSEVRESYIANYLYQESSQKEYEKELIELFENFKSEYPKSKYIQYISPLIDEIINFHKASESEFSEKVIFVKDYQKQKSLTDIAKTLPKGKIYVDVWATWCGPCISEFKYKEDLKSLLQKNNVQILYISIDRDQDSVQWKNMIKFYNLEGFHLRANKELQTDLIKIFDNNGSISIPWHILIDNNGTILKRHAKGPSQIMQLEEEINISE